MGKSSNGDLGLGTTTLADVPTQIGTDLWKSVAVGYYNACAIRADGALFCWGNNPLLSVALQYGNVPKQIGTATDWESISISPTGILGLRSGGHAYACAHRAVQPGAGDLAARRSGALRAIRVTDLRNQDQSHAMVLGPGPAAIDHRARRTDAGRHR
jgi:alpha-tubulin suppressor-like RCC1 family protein